MSLCSSENSISALTCLMISSVSSAVADGEVLGATLYALDGVKVCDLSAEEIADVKGYVQKSGIYILVKKTTRGTVTEKLIINR